MGKTISLVLSGGGARGYAHIGVIETLKKAGYTIRSISGVSMGAVVGALEACGKLREYTDWVTQKTLLDVARMIDFNFRSGLSEGLIKGEVIFGNIKRFFGDMLIEDLPIKFTAVCVNLTRGKEVWLQKGSLFEAIRASVAIPGLFVPVYRNGEMLVDGGLLNNIPIAPTMSDDTDLTVVVNVNANIPNTYPISVNDNRFERFWQRAFDFEDDPKSMAINLMMDYISKYRTAEYPADLTINISKKVCGIFDFHRHRDVIEVGRRVAEEALRRFNRQEP